MDTTLPAKPDQWALLLTHGQSWRVDEAHDTYLLECRFTEHGPLLQYCYSFTELDAIDPRIRHVLRSAHDADWRGLDIMQCLRRSYLYWESPKHIELDGKTIYWQTFTMAAFKTNGDITLILRTVDFINTPCADMAHGAVVSPFYGRKPLQKTKDALDVLLPGLAQALTIAAQMGLSDADTTDYCLAQCRLEQNRYSVTPDYVTMALPTDLLASAP